ncbi:hypothetical protein ACFWDI_03970 [Streptomyces sp. NPDC060064]|uniref:hypothetical protein n=1 Tax=Streptomyces sp. NPDC060064 TaxID=3347049 RepID=UPI0036CD19CB
MIEAPPPAVYEATRELDLRTIHSPLFDLVMWAQDSGQAPPQPLSTPPTMRVADLSDLADKHEADQPWVALGETPGRELTFGAVGKAWKPTIAVG